MSEFRKRAMQISRSGLTPDEKIRELVHAIADEFDRDAQADPGHWHGKQTGQQFTAAEAFKNGQRILANHANGRAVIADGRMKRISAPSDVVAIACEDIEKETTFEIFNGQARYPRERP